MMKTTFFAVGFVEHYIEIYRSTAKDIFGTKDFQHYLVEGKLSSL